MSALFIIFLVFIVGLGLRAGFRGLFSVGAGNVPKPKKDEKGPGFAHYFNCTLQGLNPATGTPKSFLSWFGSILLKIWKSIYVLPDFIFKSWWPNCNGKTLLRVKVCRNIFWIIVALVAIYFVKLHIDQFLDWLYMRFI